jgi:hypothetical protein
MDIHNFNTRYDTNLHSPTSNLNNFLKGAYYSGIKIFSHLPANMKCLTNDLERLALSQKRFLNSILFYTLEEFFHYER